MVETFVIDHVGQRGDGVARVNGATRYVPYTLPGETLDAAPLAASERMQPGAIRTPILTGGQFGRIQIPGATAGSVMKQWERVRPMAPEAFAEQTVDRVLANDPIIVVPRFWKALWYLDRLAPSLALRLGTKLYQQVRAEIAVDGGPDEAHATKTNGHAASPSAGH